jgi:hypothetical protein
MNARDPQPLRLGFWATLLLGVLAWAPATYPGYWQSLEGFRPIFNAGQSGAIAGVATAPDLWRGTGQSAFLLVQPLLLVGAPPVVGVRILYIAALILGGLGVYIWLNRKLGDRSAGLAALLYMLWPPLLATIYLRGSVSDAWMLGLLPLVLAGVAAYAETRSPSAAGVVVLGILWMWRTQAGLAVFATVLIFLYTWLVERSRLTALTVAVSAAAGLVSLAPLWHIHSPTSVIFADHFVYPHQLLYGDWTLAPSVQGWQDTYPFQLGFASLAFAVVALWLWRTRSGEQPNAPVARLMAFNAIAVVILVLLCLPISEPLWTATGADRLLTYPWQLLLLAGPLLAALAGSLPSLNLGLARAPLWASLVAAVMLSSYPYLRADFTQVRPPAAPVATFGADNQIVLLQADLTAVEDEQGVAADQAQLDITWQVLESLPADYNVFFQALAPKGEQYEVVTQLDVQPLQGERPATSWQPGEILTDTYRLDLGQVVGDVEPDTANLRFYFGYYDWRDGARLPVDGGIDDKLVFYGY